MSAFEDFIQRELPKRGYLDSDVPTESIIVRRGAGVRQFDAVTLTDGQVLAMKNGVLQGVSLSAGGGSSGIPTIRTSITHVNTAAMTWNIAHNLGSENVIIQTFDENKAVILPNSITIVDSNTVTVTFSSAQAGTARIIFLD